MNTLALMRRFVITESLISCEENGCYCVYLFGGDNALAPSEYLMLKTSFPVNENLLVFFAQCHADKYSAEYFFCYRDRFASNEVSKINTIGIKPKKMMLKAAVDASLKRSSAANLYTLVANVSKLKGRKIKVAGNSFITSINTNNRPLSNAGRSNGKWICCKTLLGEAPQTSSSGIKIVMKSSHTHVSAVVSDC